MSQETKRGWGTSGKLHTGSRTDLVSVQAKFDEPGTYTVQFSKSDNAAANNPTFAEALITWVVEGNYVTRRVNVADGVSVSGVGQGFKVQMMDATSPTFGANNGAEYLVACQCAPGVRGGNKQPPTLVPSVGFVAGGSTAAPGGSGFFAIPPGGGVVISLPQDAGIISTFVTVGAAAAIAEFGVTVSMIFNNQVIRIYDPRDVADWVPLVPGSTSLLLENGTAQTVDFAVTFGIDG